jgi:hypothetical protein
MTIALLLLILVSLWIGFHELFKQQGRILLRLDELESRTCTGHHGLEHAGEQAEAAGLPFQSQFPAFSLPDLAG